MLSYRFLPYTANGADGLVHGTLRWMRTKVHNATDTGVMDMVPLPGSVFVSRTPFIWETWCETTRDWPVAPYRRGLTGYRDRPVTCLACLACALKYTIEEM